VQKNKTGDLTSGPITRSVKATPTVGWRNFRIEMELLKGVYAVFRRQQSQDDFFAALSN